ncbi:ABC transporter ATP-binding protein [Gymnodinialimonas sp. 2305UL16-5]|uniref:ABC transporter ATP-binding protein n=1 Tax=Gymnodinialimonas mytili TaxID=3126503 RepID=UPI0030A0884D
MSLLHAEKVVVGYNSADTILKGVSIRADSGEIVAILGPNGAGKSTLLKAVAGQLAAREGSIRLKDEPLNGLKPREVAKRGVAYVPQEANVFPSMSIHENLEIGGYLAPSDVKRRIAEIYARFPMLAEKRREAARTLSGGQRQVLAVAIALMVAPQVMLLDEPSAGLSPVATRELFDTIRSIRDAGVAIVLVEQNALDALDLAERAYILTAGQNHIDGKASELAADADVRRAFLGG